MSVMAVAAACLYAIFAVAATNDECDDAWDDAPAEAYCRPNEGAMAATADNTCLVGASACSITVDVTESGTTVSETFTPSFPSAWTYLTSDLSLDKTDDIDICFDGGDADTDASNIVATVRTACRNYEVNSSDAVSNGLDLPWED